MVPASPYEAARVALATRHGKERVIGRALRHGLGAELIHRPELDTDQLGSFCGTVARRGSTREACLAKADLALRDADTDLAIASEGSFGPHPALPFLPVGQECMVFLDASRGLTISEELLAPRTNFAHRWLACSVATAPSRHGLIVRSAAAPGFADDGGQALLRKGIRSVDALVAAVREAAAVAVDGRVLLETDMRAHCNPTRMAAIRQLSFLLVRRLSSLCPSCGAPGWAVVDSEPGLRASAGAATAGPDGLTRADPGHCPACNP
ncbi:MAG: DUF6671 family protein [Cyanobacteriota bacterium]|jgi:hypothetical protein